MEPYPSRGVHDDNDEMRRRYDHEVYPCVSADHVENTRYVYTTVQRPHDSRLRDDERENHNV